VKEVNVLTVAKMVKKCSVLLCWRECSYCCIFSLVNHHVYVTVWHSCYVIVNCLTRLY